MSNTPALAVPGKELVNHTTVRHTVGYDRWETAQELALLESIYDDLRLYIDFFQPSLKLIALEDFSVTFYLDATFPPK
jgi:hypothetical protein